jgi:hypothetical protein
VKKSLPGDHAACAFEYPAGGSILNHCSQLAANSWVQMIGFGRPVVPEVCRTTSGSFLASSNVLSYG